MNVPISLVLLLTSFQCLWAKRSFYERSRIGEPTERNNGSLPKRSDIDVLNVDKNCFEEPNGVITANLQWMWIDPDSDRDPLTQVTDILDELEQHMTFLFRNEYGAVAWAYPVTVERTPHHMTFSTGEQVHAA
jgi:hypothetical protein